jgi:WD40 repeat protein
MKLYNINGKVLNNNKFDIIFPQLSKSDYSFTSNKLEKCDSVTLFDFDGTKDSLQSVGYDYKNKHFYKFMDNTTVLKFDEKLQQTKITLPASAGHCNDACYYDGKFYLADGVSNNKLIYIWDIANNTISSKTVNGIENNTNGSSRYLAGICEVTRGSGKFYLLCRDVDGYSDITHKSGDKMSIYLYELETNTATLLKEFDWDCVYIQGCTCINGILYVTCNTATTGSASNYKGITIKVINTLGWEMIDTLICNGNFEAEGMDFIQCGTDYYISMGVAKWSEIAVDILFKHLY